MNVASPLLRLLVGFASCSCVFAADVADPAASARNIPGAAPRVPETGPAPAAPVAPSAAPVAQYPITGTVRPRLLQTLEVITELPRRADIPTQPAARNQALLATGDGTAFLADLRTRYVGKNMDGDTAAAIAKEILDFHFRHDRRMVHVQPAAADFDNGSIRILAMEARLEKKAAKGGQWFSERLTLQQLHGEAGDYIDHRQLLSDLIWINDNPFLRANTVFRPGAIPGTTAIDLEVQDRFPLSGYLGLENTGSQQTGEWRGMVGANWGNAFGLGHQLSYQFSAPWDDINSQPVHALIYRVPLPWRHHWTTTVVLAQSNISLARGVGIPNLEFGGDQWQIGTRYELKVGEDLGPHRQRVFVGLDYKKSDLAFAQGGVTVPANRTDVIQLRAGYRAARDDASGRTEYSVNLVYSPGGLNERNGDGDYQAVDPRLRSTYAYGLVSVGRTQRLPRNWTLAASFSGQLADRALLSSEQIGVGGVGSVRGYRERVVFGDRGLYANIETRMPPGRFPLGAKNTGTFQFMGFLDGAIVSSADPLPTDPSSQHLLSVGAGGRLLVGESLSLRVDVGVPLRNPHAGFPVDSARAHVAATWTF
jgi:hemolysin activation/secretion protein